MKRKEQLKLDQMLRLLFKLSKPLSAEEVERLSHSDNKGSEG